MSSLSQQIITARVCRQIEPDEKLGDQAGGSGHLTHVSYELLSAEVVPGIEYNAGSDETAVLYSYRLQYQSEFNYETGDIATDEDNITSPELEQGIEPGMAASGPAFCPGGSLTHKRVVRRDSKGEPGRTEAARS